MTGTPAVAAILPRLMAVSSRLHQMAQSIHGVILSRTNPGGASKKDLMLRQYFARAVGWIATLSRIDDCVHFQAYAAAMRGLLETAVDMLLVHDDRPTDCVDHIEFWGESAQLAGCNRLLSHYVAKPPLPPEFQTISQYVQSGEARIKAQRRIYWPKSKEKHPPRWTAPSDVDALAWDLDARPACAPCQHFELHDVIAEHGSPLNWYVHGSGFAGLSNIDTTMLEAGCAQNVCYSIHLVVVCANVARHHFDLHLQLPKQGQELVEVVKELSLEYTTGCAP